MAPHRKLATNLHHIKQCKIHQILLPRSVHSCFKPASRRLISGRSDENPIAVLREVKTISLDLSVNLAVKLGKRRKGKIRGVSVSIKGYCREKTKLQRLQSLFVIFVWFLGCGCLEPQVKFCLNFLCSCSLLVCLVMVGSRWCSFIGRGESHKKCRKTQRKCTGLERKCRLDVCNTWVRGGENAEKVKVWRCMTPEVSNNQVIGKPGHLTCIHQSNLELLCQQTNFSLMKRRNRPVLEHSQH